MPSDEPPQIQLTHVRLLVTEYEACYRFYRDVFGFPVTWGDESTGYADFDAGDATLALYDRTAMADAVDTEDLPADEPQQDAVAVIFSVDNVDDAFERFRSNAFERIRGDGIEAPRDDTNDGFGDEVDVVTEPHDQPGWGIRVAHVRDPDGTLLEINEPLEGGMQ